MKRLALRAVFVTGLFLFGCEVGQGDGTVQSDWLHAPECWEGPFDLRPTFFAANPYQNTMMIKVQQGQQQEEEADGVLILVNDVASVRDSMIGESIPLALPASVTPPGVPVIPGPPPLVTLALYLHATCHAQNSALYAVGGWIRFDSLFSGNLNEDNAERRLTQAQFEAIVADPRDGVLGTDAAGGAALTYPAGVTSVVKGDLQFFFHRGTPAQPFP